MSKSKYRNPNLSVDIIIEIDDKIVLIERKNAPLGWAIPGGFVDYGECVEAAAVREAMEEVQLEVELQELLYVYSDPARDPRQHVASVAFVASASGEPHAADDAKHAALFAPEQLPETMCFDHRQILEDYLAFRRDGKRPSPMRALVEEST